MAKYLDNRSQNRISLAMAAIGVTLMCWGSHRLNNPQFVDPEPLPQAIYQDERAWSAAPSQQEDNAYRLLSFLILSSGIGLVAASVLGACTDPISNVPEVDASTGTTITPVSDVAALKDSFTLRLKKMLRDAPILMKIISSGLLIVVGDMGAGKSTFIGVVSLLRFLIYGDAIHIYDPHYDANLAKGYNPFLVGKVFKTPEEIRANIGLALECRADADEPNKPKATNILEEYSNWATDQYGLGVAQKSVSESGTQNIRKYDQRYILALHGLNKDMCGKDMDSGRHGLLLRTACIVHLHGKSNDFTGEGEPTGYMSVSLPGKDITPEKMPKLTKREVPGILLPPDPENGRKGIRAELGELARQWGITVETKADRDNVIPTEVHQYLNRINRDSPELRKSLEALIQQEAEHFPDGESLVEDNSELLEKLDALTAYCQRKHSDWMQQEILNEKGFIPVEILRKNWASNKKINIDMLRAILQLAVDNDRGTWGDDESKWWKPTL